MPGTSSIGAQRASASGFLRGALRSPLLRQLLLLDALLIAIHLLVATSPREAHWWWADTLRIDRDRSLSEWVETAKLATAILLLLLLVHVRQAQRPCYRTVAALLAFMAIDNILGLHENLALFAPGSQMLGEFLLVSGICLVVAGLAWFTYRRAAAYERSALVAIGLVLVLFGLMAVGVDLLHELTLPLGLAVYAAFAVLEDGGELVTLSLLLALVVHLTRGADALPEGLRRGGD